MTRTRRTVTASALLLAALSVGFALLLSHPGGPLSVVSTHGASMVPTIDPDSLVLVRTARRYEIGDIAAYESDDLGTIVLHRIVDTDGDRFVLRGDANDWLDTDRPTADQVLGTAWLTIPGAGRLARIPSTAWAGLLAGLLFVGGRTTRAASARPSGGRRRRIVASPTVVEMAQRATVPIAVLLLAAGAASAIAFAHPTSQPGPVGYTHEGEFTYAGRATPGLVHPDGEVTTGDPIFLQLVDELEVTYAHRLTTSGSSDLRSRTDLALAIGNGDDWEHTLPGTPTVESDSARSELSVTIDATDIRTYFERFEDETGISANARRVTVRAEVEVHGEIDGAPLDDTFTAELALAVDDGRLRVIEGLGPHRDERSVTVEDAQPAEFGVLGYPVDVTQTRVGSLLAGGLTSVVLALITVIRTHAREGDGTTRLRARLGGALVQVASVRPPGDRTLVELTEIDDLVRIARGRGAPVIHRRWAETDTYLVDDGAAVYWYGADVPEAAPPRGPQDQGDAVR